jgi:predicted transcriptional regulator
MRLRKHIVLRIDEKSLKAVQRIAKQEDESVARIIRRAIVAFVERYKRK